MCNKSFAKKSYVEKIEKRQKVFSKEKSIYVLQSFMCYELCVVCYRVFPVCYSSKPKNKS